MIAVVIGGRVYGPGVFMSIEEAAAVKDELTKRGTKESRRLADEIGIPSDGRAYAKGIAETDRETVEDVLDEMRRCSVERKFDYIRGLAVRIKNALKIERALRMTEEG